MKTFREDLQSFINFLQNNDNPDEIRKEYRRMVKLYHPDIAPENQKQIYNDYILLINKVYSDGKTRAKETVIDTDKKSVNREYIFTKKGADGKIYNYKCRNYYDYLFKIARYEYDTGHAILHFHHLNYLDKKAMDQNSLEVMQHWWNAIKCYKYLLKNCQDVAILDTCLFELEMTQKSVNNLSRTLASSDGKEIMKI